MRKAFALFVFIVAPLFVYAAEPEVVSTRCRELDVPLDATHSSARLAGCGEESSSDLLWHLDRIDQLDGGILDGQYHRRHPGAGSVIYVMDTGVLASHAEFMRGDGVTRVIAGFDVTQAVNVGGSACRSANKALRPCYDDMAELIGASHGTSVASLAAGSNIGVASDAFIVSVRVMNESALATTRTYLDGLNAIVRHSWSADAPPFHTAVVNISGWVLERLIANPDPRPVPFAAVEQKMRDMIAGVDAQGRVDPNGKRFLFVAVAGNTGQCSSSGAVAVYPGILGTQIDGLITVGGIDRANHFWSGSCAGGAIDILAPAENILVASISAANRYRGKGLGRDYSSGTSYAAPYVAGIAARILEDEPALTPVELEQRIKASPSFISDAGAPAGGRVAVLIESEPPAASPRRRAVAR